MQLKFWWFFSSDCLETQDNLLDTTASKYFQKKIIQHIPEWMEFTTNSIFNPFLSLAAQIHLNAGLKSYHHATIVRKLFWFLSPKINLCCSIHCFFFSISFLLISDPVLSPDIIPSHENFVSIYLTYDTFSIMSVTSLLSYPYPVLSYCEYFSLSLVMDTSNHSFLIQYQFVARFMAIHLATGKLDKIRITLCKKKFQY